MLRYTVFIFFLLVTACGRKQNALLYNAPEQEPNSPDFEMFVDERPVFVYQARVSKFPVNQIWPGYQRPLGQTEIASFAYFDMKKEVNVKIVSKNEVRNLEIRPRELGIRPALKGNTIEFNLAGPQQLIVEVNGYHHALHIFANPLEPDRIREDNPGVHYFGPGVHDAGIIRLESNETVYIAGGAVVYGVIASENARNITIAGRGILDASKIERGKAPNMISLKEVVNAQISGIILRDPHNWAVVPVNCDSIEIDNIKLIGLWRYNSDGIDLVNSRNIRVRNSFIRAFDDNIAIKGLKRSWNENFRNIENILISKCILWNDWGRALEIGAETVADTIRNIVFSDCYIPHFTAVAMDIQNCDRGVVENIRFRNISVEDPISDSLTIGTTPIVKNAWGKIIVVGVYGSFYSNDTIRGKINNIHFENIRFDRTLPEKEDAFGYDDFYIDEGVQFRNYDLFIRDNMYFGDIRYNCTHSNTVYLTGIDSVHTVDNIHIRDYFINGKKVTGQETVGRNEFVGDIVIHSD